MAPPWEGYLPWTLLPASSPCSPEQGRSGCRDLLESLLGGLAVIAGRPLLVKNLYPSVHRLLAGL